MAFAVSHTGTAKVSATDLAMYPAWVKARRKE